MIACGIDFGTQSVKVVCYDSIAKKIVAQASCPLQLISAEDGTREQEASWWVDAMVSCFDAIDPAIRKKIETVGVSGQQHGFVPVDDQGKVMHSVKLWCDTSTSAQCSTLMDACGGEEAVRNRTGNAVLPGYTASKILWFKQQYPTAFSLMEHVFLPHDYINWYLTHVPAMEWGDASGTGLMDIRTGTWDTQLVDAIDPSLFQKIPQILPSSLGILGTVVPEVAERLGLGASVQVSCGGGDNMMGAIGTGCVDSGMLTMSLGTSGTLFGCSDVPIVDPSGCLAAFRSSTDSFLPLLCTMNCTVATEVMRQLLAVGVREFDTMAESSPIGAGGLLLIPYFNGERSPNLPQGKGTLCGMTATNVTPANIARSSIEGATYSMMMGLDSFHELGFVATGINLIGGGANSPVWRKMVSDMANLPVRVPMIAEAAAFGAALQALSAATGTSLKAIAADHVSYDPAKSCMPNEERHAQYMQHYAVWKEYLQALSPLFE